jgi:hypothetical protein
MKVTTHNGLAQQIKATPELLRHAISQVYHDESDASYDSETANMPTSS